MAVAAGVACVQQLHRPQVDLTSLHRHWHALLNGQPLSEQRGKCFIHEASNSRVFLAKDGGVVSIGGNALQAVEQGLLERADVLVRIQRRNEFQGRALLRQAVDRVRRNKGRCRMSNIDLAELGLQALAQLDRLADQRGKAVRIKVDVGERGENRLHREAVQGRINNAALAGLVSIERQPAEGVDQHILNIGQLAVLAADSGVGAGDAFGGLFALVAVHTILLI